MRGDKAIRGLCAAEFRMECAERQKKTVIDRSAIPASRN
jgi:hypothetical protein